VAKINASRVILGGLAAGLAYNVINWFAHGAFSRLSRIGPWQS
jgi:hypothetical protein